MHPKIMGEERRNGKSGQSLRLNQIWSLINHLPTCRLLKLRVLIHTVLGTSGILMLIRFGKTLPIVFGVVKNLMRKMVGVKIA